MLETISFLSKIMIPAILAFIPLYAAYRKIPVYESFVEGAKEGFPTAIQLIPHLVGMMVAVSVFRETGALQFYLGLFKPLVAWVGFPEEAFLSVCCDRFQDPDPWLLPRVSFALTVPIPIWVGWLPPCKGVRIPPCMY